ncbi:MAG TPA: hypothetical protein VGE72_15540 [Azospirillum sp.]
MNEEHAPDLSSAGPPSDSQAQTLPVVNAIIATATSAALKRGSEEDVGLGVIAALRRLRATAQEEAGLTVVAAIDTVIRSRLLAENLTHLRASGAPPDAITIPAAGRGTNTAAAIFESAADSCLAVNAHAPDNGPLELAVYALTGQLVQRFGGTPAWPALKDELDRPLGGHIAAPTSVLPIEGAPVH